LVILLRRLGDSVVADTVDPMEKVEDLVPPTGFEPALLP
jgi:hypothetical protein